MKKACIKPWNFNFSKLNHLRFSEIQLQIGGTVLAKHLGLVIKNGQDGARNNHGTKSGKDEIPGNIYTEIQRCGRMRIYQKVFEHFKERNIVGEQLEKKPWRIFNIVK